MKTLVIVLILVLVTGSALAEDITNTKLLLHGTKPIIEDSSWQVSAWGIVPNFTSNPNVSVFVAGPRYEMKDRWWIEAMAGALTVNQKSEPLIDIRASYDVLDPIHLWTNVEYFPKEGNWYAYLDLNYRLPVVGLIGIETENNLPNHSKADLSIGPRIVLPFSDGKFVLISAYQFHNFGENQLWIRTVFNF